MTGYNRDNQRAYDNQSPDESHDARDEWIAERAEAIVDERISDLAKVAAALDDMGGFERWSDIGTTGSTILSEMVALIVTAPWGAETENAILAVHDAVLEYMTRDAETDAETEWNKGDE